VRKTLSLLGLDLLLGFDSPVGKTMGVRSNFVSHPAVTAKAWMHCAGALGFARLANLAPRGGVDSGLVKGIGTKFGSAGAWDDATSYRFKARHPTEFPSPFPILVMRANVCR
jgi:hypothetical protein